MNAKIDAVLYQCSTSRNQQKWQEAVLDDYCDKAGLFPRLAFYDYGPTSVPPAERPPFQSLLTAAEGEEIQHIVVADPTQLSRDPVVIQQTLRLLARHGVVNLHFVTGEDCPR